MVSNIGEALTVLEAGGTVAGVTDRDVVVVAGPDAADYLQGQLSQDVVGLAVGDTTWSFLLQPQGKVDAWFRATRLAPELFVFDLRSGYGSTVVERLNRFKLRVDVDVSTFASHMLAVRGDGAADEAERLAAQMGAVVVPADWNDGGQYDIVFVDGAGQSVSSTVEVGRPAELGDLEWVESRFLEWDRIRGGIPAMGSELDESTIPAASAVVDVSADFTKGCYVGQELVARVDSRGSNTPTKLVRMAAETNLLAEPGATVVVDGDDAGRITSAVSSGHRLLALGYLKRSVVDAVVDWPLAGSTSTSDGERIELSIELVRHTEGE